MNLFLLDNSFEKNAEYHVDSHCGKMILESLQVVCTTFHLQGITAPYKPTHARHPVSIFCQTTKDNFNFVCEYAYALSKEFTYRYDKVHKSSLLLKWVWDNQHLLSFPKTGLTDFALAMPEQYKTSDPVTSYRKYYIFEKRHLASWKNREVPYWYNEEYFNLSV